MVLMSEILRVEIIGILGVSSCSGEIAEGWGKELGLRMSLENHLNWDEVS